MLTTEGDQFSFGFRSRGPADHKLHSRLDLFPQVGIRHAKHRGIGDLGMGDGQVLALLREMFTPPEMIMNVLRSVR